MPDLTNWPGAHHDPVVRVARDCRALGRVLARRLVDTLTFRLKDEWVSAAHVVIGGGLVVEEMIDALTQLPERGAVDWQRVHVWWSDERYLPAGHIGRHETRARAAGLGRVGIDDSRVHAMPAPVSDRDVRVERVAADYAKLLRLFSPFGRTGPVFDVVLLDVGAAGEVAALYPGAPSLEAVEPVVTELDAPTTPRQRTTLTLPIFTAAARVWLLADGADVAAAVGRAIDGASPHETPAAGARGVLETIWWLDEAAASAVPQRFRGVVDPELSPAG